MKEKVLKFEIEKVDCREKDSEIRDLKEKVVKLEMEKADCREKDSETKDLKKKVVKLEMEKAELIHSLVNAWLNVINAFYGSSNLAMSNISWEREKTNSDTIYIYT